MIWAGVLVGALACYLLKLAGLSLPARLLDSPVVQRIALLVPVTLLAALIAVQTLGLGRDLVIDARLPGVLVAGAAVWRRWPFLIVVVSAAATTACWRLVFPGT